jgi:hypothetical protein
MTLNPFIDDIYMYILVCARAGTQLRGYPVPDTERSSDGTVYVLYISERRAGRHRVFHAGQDPLSIGASSTDQRFAPERYSLRHSDKPIFASNHLSSSAHEISHNDEW